MGYSPAKKKKRAAAWRIAAMKRPRANGAASRHALAPLAEFILPGAFSGQESARDQVPWYEGAAGLPGSS